MSMNFRTWAAICAVAVGFTGCSESSSSGSSDISSVSAAESSGESETSVSSEPGDSSAVVESHTADISFADSGISVSGEGASVSGNTVTISKAGVYYLSGNSSDAKVIISADKKNDDVTVILGGVSLTAKNGCVIDCESAKSFTLTLSDNTENSVSDTENYTFEEGEDEPDAAVFSRSDMKINGGGSLAVTGNYKDGIKCKDGLVINGGEITVKAGGDGIKSTNDTDGGMGYIDISGGVIDITAAKDGIQAETTLTVKGGKITAETGGEAAHEEITNKPGDPFDRDTSSGDTESMKGIKSGGDMVIDGGEIVLTSADDTIHSNANVKINGGSMTLSSCDDGVHADETLTIKDGTITVTKSYEGLEGKNIEISGGNIEVVASDDGINAAGGDNGQFFGFNDNSEEYYISVSGGNITVNAEGDGIDSNGTIAQSGGNIVVYGPVSSGNGALDYEKSFAVSGGTLIALGSSGMAQAPSTLSQPCLSIYADVKADSVISVKDADGKVILTTTTPKQCSSLIFSSDKFVAGNDYSIYAGEELLSTVTAENGVSGGGASAQGGMGGGFGGGMGGHGGRPGGARDDLRQMGGFAYSL